MNYTIYNETTGKIVRTISCSPAQSVNQVHTGEGMIEGDYDSTYWINNGIPELKVLPNPHVPAYHFHDLLQYMDTDVDLNDAIENLGEDPTAYRLQYWEEFRIADYPPLADLADAMVKQSDPETKDTGDAQMVAYKAKGRAVKARFPKPDVVE